MKKCLKCEQEKEISLFGKDKQKADGLNPYCKECIKKRSAAQRINNPEYCKTYAERYRQENRELLRDKSHIRFIENKEECLRKARESYLSRKDQINLRRKEIRQTPAGRERNRLWHKAWRNKNPKSERKAIRKWQVNNREKINAHAKVHRAVVNGSLIRGTNCEKCGTSKGKMEGHHEDYSKPLEVQWLCRFCHSQKISKL